MTSEETQQTRLALQRPDLLRQRAFVGGEWFLSNSGQVFPVFNPATGTKIGCVPVMSAPEIEKVIGVAEVAFHKWRCNTALERADALMRWYELISKNAADLSRLLTAEQGKPLAEANAEVTYAASFVRWFAEEARRTYGDTVPGFAKTNRMFTLKQPIGVAAAITPWNFPLAMITRKAAAALAAGCSMVVKPSELTPFSALALAVLADEARLPDGIFNVVTGDPAVIAKVLTHDQRVRKLSFTGSTRVGKLLMEQCAGTVKKLSLELGGNAPFIVFDDADLSTAVAGAMAAKFRNAGQTCICANRIFVQTGIYDAFTNALAEKVASLIVGNGLDQNTDQGPLINDAAITKVVQHVQDALAKGARVKTGGVPHGLAGTFFVPTVLTDMTDDMLIASEETFGPIAPLFRFDTEEEVLNRANSTQSGLAGYVFTSNINRFIRMSENLECGMVGVNTGSISTETAPFGGVKESGLGREGAHDGIEEYLETKYVCLGGAF